MNIEIVIFDGVQVLDATGPMQVFATANDCRVPPTSAAPPYAVRAVARGATVYSSAGLGLLAAPLPRIGSPIDTLIIAGGKGVHRAAADVELINWLALRARDARRVASVCSGAFLLGAAGLLDGKRVVTHWMDCDRLAKQFATAQVERQPIYIEDGSLWTSAGVTAGIDMSLALVERDLGRATALAVARDLVVFMKRPGGQAQFSSMLALQSTDDQFDRLHSWIVAHLAEDLSISALAAVVGKSERSFIRHYKSKTGQSPARAVEMFRVEAARQMLIDGSAPIKRITRTCGFGTEETMRRSFLRVLEMSPQSVRMMFRNA